MPIRVDAYIAGGRVSGVLSHDGHLRDALEAGAPLVLDQAESLAIGETEVRPAGRISLEVDDVLVAVGDDDPSLSVHATWHAVELDIGPYRIDGELPTMPGFDPDRALTRPSGEFVMLRDVRLAMLGGSGPGVAIGEHALVNRYDVERVAADIMLGFFFPGAVMDGFEAKLPQQSPGAAAR